MALCADDIKICILDKNVDAVQERLNRFMKQFKTWFSNNSLPINTDTTRAMLFHSNKTSNLIKPKIVYNNAEINCASKTNFLGTDISNNLKWNTHNQVLCSKLNNIFYMIASLERLNIIYVKKYYFAKL